MQIIKTSNYTEMSKKACEFVMKLMKEKSDLVLGLATGSTPEGLYKCLIDGYQKGEISFQNTTTFNLDEYVGLTSNHPNSYQYFMREKLFKHIDITEENIYIPNGDAADTERECLHYERALQQHGPIDLQILGIGMNGHIGFNEPGTNFTSRTHVVELDESTRQANSRFFTKDEDIPKHAITMGIETIMESKEIILLVSGEKKAPVVRKLMNGEITENIPASVLKKHNRVTVIADKAALKEINR